MLLVVLAAAALLTGCSGEDDSATRTLLDGSPPPELAVELEGVDGDVVVTSHATVSTTAPGDASVAGTCMGEAFPQLDAAEIAVVRTGVTTETVTFKEAPDVAIFGCENTPGQREDDRRWCSSAYGELESGQLRDPRLSILCETADGHPVGFVWVEPGADTTYVAVAQPDFTEVYEVAGGLPIRIATVDGVDVETSSATFEVSEHDAEGRLLREQTLEAFVAG